MESELYRSHPQPWFTVFTCTYNRAHTLADCYESLLSQQPLDPAHAGPDAFEWIVVDDGSSDGTRGLVEGWIADNRLSIRYIYQKNQGKHVASNQAIDAARGYAILSYDSDDILFPEALRVLYTVWNGIDPEIRATLKGATARYVDSSTGKLLGDPVPGDPFIVSSTDMRFRHHIDGDMLGFNLTEIMRRHKFPVFDGAARYCPESIVWFEMAREYREAVVNTLIGRCNTGGNDKITRGSSRNRAPQNYHLWRYELNNLVSRYFMSAPKEMLKPIVGMSMDGLRTGRSLGTILRDVNGFWRRLAVVIFFPAGYILSRQ